MSRPSVKNERIAIANYHVNWYVRRVQSTSPEGLGNIINPQSSEEATIAEVLAESRLGEISVLDVACVMNQHFFCAGGDVVGVDVVNGWVECWGVVGGVPQQVSCFDYVPVCGEEVVAWVDVLRLLPRLISDIPKLVILSRGDRRVADFELDEGVFVWPNRGYRTSAGISALRVMGPNEG